MAIVRHVAPANATWSSAAVTSISLQLAWAQATLGDRALALVSSIATNPTFTTPTGWTALGTYKPTTTLATAVYYRDYVVDDPTAVTYNWVASTAGRMTVAYVVYTGTDLTLPPLVTQNATLGSSRTATAPAVTMADGDFYVGFTAGRQSPGDAAAIGWAPTAGYYEWYDLLADATGTTPQLTSTVYDTGGPTGAVSTTGVTTAAKNLAEVNNWAIRLRAPLSQAGWRVGMPIR